MSSICKFLAFYLPQYHPIPENNEWWGKGFTEWTNTAKAKPLYSGHYQPHIPADLGFYDLRLPEARIAQADLAREYGIEGFCYYHYWFAGRRILERPFDEVLESGVPNYPFCLCWANETWSGIWHGDPKRVLIEQTYPGTEDYDKHFDFLLRAFVDPRYIKIDDKPVFIIYKPMDLPDPRRFTDHFRERASRAGLKGLFLIGHTFRQDWKPSQYGFDASVVVRIPPKIKRWESRRHPIRWAKNIYRNFLESSQRIPFIASYEHDFESIAEFNDGEIRLPTVIPNWDNTPRSGMNGRVLHGSSPQLFAIKVREALKYVIANDSTPNVVFIKSWNEWAEGNHLEPDLLFGRSYLEVIRTELKNKIVLLDP